MSQGKLVFSTDSGSHRKAEKKPATSKSSGPNKMRLETKGRGGKSVTVLWNLTLAEADLKAMIKDIQARCACGSSYKKGQVEFQGDVRVQVEALFKEKAWKIVRAGG